MFQIWYFWENQSKAILNNNKRADIKFALLIERGKYVDF
jgi:hypothetical protein